MVPSSLANILRTNFHLACPHECLDLCVQLSSSEVVWTYINILGNCATFSLEEGKVV